MSENNNTITTPNVKAKITWINDDPTQNKKAAALITIADCFTVHGISIVDGPKGLFISMPQRTSEKSGEKQFNEVAHPVTSEMRKAIHDAVFKAYSQTMAISKQYRREFDKQKNENPHVQESSDEPEEESSNTPESSSISGDSDDESEDQDESCGVLMGQVM